MRISLEGLRAALKLAIEVGDSDGVVEQDEIDFISNEIESFGVDYNELLSTLDDLSHDDAVATVSALPTQAKQYACALIGTMMASDGDIEDEEISKWQVLTEECGFPEMSLQEAIDLLEKLNAK